MEFSLFVCTLFVAVVKILDLKIAAARIFFVYIRYRCLAHNCLFLQSHFIWLIQTWMADRGLTTFGTDTGPPPLRGSFPHRSRGPGYVFFCPTEPEAHRLRQVKAWWQQPPRPSPHPHPRLRRGSVPIAKWIQERTHLQTTVTHRHEKFNGPGYKSQVERMNYGRWYDTSS